MVLMSMRIVYHSVLIVGIGFILLTVTAFAAGGGGGGSVPSCTDNVWTCNDWSSCSTAGMQTRTCNLTFSCATATNQKPPESQSCIPPTPVPTPTPQSSAKPMVSTPTPQSSAVPTATPTPSCTASTWQCGGWSASCDASGQEHRSCHLVADCAQSPTSSPPTAQACSRLQCGNKQTLRERISCRLSLAPSGVARELQIQYLPEECRVIPDSNEKKECIARYKSYRPCWNLPEGEGRFECARNVLKLKTSVAGEIQACRTSTNTSTCTTDLKEKVLYMIKFRFYDLEQRAEDLYYRGADSAAIAVFDTIVETKKQEFDQVKSTGDFKRIILDVRSAWQNFMNQVKDQIK